VCSPSTENITALTTSRATWLGNRKQRQYMVQASKELEMMPTTEGALDSNSISRMLSTASTQRHTLPIAPLYNDVIQMFAKSGIAELSLAELWGPHSMSDYRRSQISQTLDYIVVQRSDGEGVFVAVEAVDNMREIEFEVQRAFGRRIISSSFEACTIYWRCLRLPTT